MKNNRLRNKMIASITNKQLHNKYQYSSFGLSLCTTCMGRLHHLKQTMPYNIKSCEKSNINYEICLVNWNSSDGLHEWIMKNYSNLINNGKIKYLYLTNPKYFEMAPAKNKAHKLATKKYVCNVDADNFISEEYIKEISSVFANDNNTIIKGSKGTSGRICLSRNHFHKLGGYDEDFKLYGYDDVNLLFRAKEIGLKIISLNIKQDFIDHDDALRTKNMKHKSSRKKQLKKSKILHENKVMGIPIT